MYGSSQLVPGRSLAEYGVVDGSTIGLALRLRGGAPKKRCKFMLNPTDQCSQAAVRIVGDCQLCSLSFCARHRLAEGAWFHSLSYTSAATRTDQLTLRPPRVPCTDHSCAKLSTCREQAFERNKVRSKCRLGLMTTD